jgi:hypothetical protein
MKIVGNEVAIYKPGPTPQLPSAGDQQLRAARGRRYFQWCAAEESCVAIFVFLWTSLSALSAWLIGVDQQATVLQPVLAQIGGQIKNRTIAV